ncbi:hypothetical protein [Pseudomonas sp.]|uniref:hypothetical protein n=1 Tax=Pseudomonas sp. TaxID=306 RepID=UPI002586E7DA|nr:hypothetical protein [Pseudomonas sp.]
MYQLLPNTPMGAATCIKRLSDNAFIPFDNANTDYAAFKLAATTGKNADGSVFTMQDATGAAMTAADIATFISALH